MITIICGPMFAGKTTEIWKVLDRSFYEQKSSVAISPTSDTRGDSNQIVARNGLTKNSITISDDIRKNEDAIFKFLRVENSYDVVVFDESQFFKGITSLVRRLHKDGVEVYCAGLDTDYRMQPFGEMGELLAIANRVKKLTAVCKKCQGEASRTQRIIDGVESLSGDLVLIGDSESYESRCDSCYRSL